MLTWVRGRREGRLCIRRGRHGATCPARWVPKLLPPTSTARPRSPRSPSWRLILESPPPPPAPHLLPTPSPLLPVPAAASRRPKGLGSYTPPHPASGPTPRFCPRPPPASPAASAAPGLAPCASCGGGGAERRQAQPGRWGQRHTEARRLGERRRGGRDGAWTAVDRGRAHQAKRSAHQAPGTERGGTGDLWPSMHRVPSPAAEQPPGRGDNTRRTPQPRLKLVGKRCRGVEMGGAGLGNGVRRVEVEKRTWGSGTGVGGGD